MASPADLRFAVTLLAGALAGAASLIAFGKLTNQEELRRRRNRIQARVMELRLYRDEPAVILRALSAIVTGNVRLIGTILTPIAVLIVPLALLTIHLDALLGHQPLPLNTPTLLTARLTDTNLPVTLTVPAGIQLETPPVRVEADHEIAWRLRAVGPVSGELRLQVGNQSVEKSIRAADHFTYLQPSRERGIFALLTAPFESRLPDGPIQSIRIAYPTCDWFTWFLLASLPAALLAKVVFRIQM